MFYDGMHASSHLQTMLASVTFFGPYYINLRMDCSILVYFLSEQLWQ